MTAQEAFELLYNGTGVVYVTDDSGLLSPYGSESGLATWEQGVENQAGIQGRLLDIFATNSGYSVNGYSTSLCTMTLAGANNCTAVNVGGVNQLSGPVAMIAADIPGSVAAIVAAINAYNVAPASDNCRAVQSGNNFYLVQTVAGNSHNGETVAITFSTVASAATGTNMAGGRAAAGRPYRIFLDPSPTADPTVLNPGSAVEITEVASFKGLESPTVSQNVVVATNSVVYERTSSFMQIYIDGVTTVGAANRVDSILGLGAIEGDVVILSGIDGSTPPIINTGSLAYLEYVRTLTGYASTLTIRMAEDGLWYQTTPNPTSAASIRASGLPVPLQPGVFQMAPAGGTATITPGQTGVSAFPGTVYEHNVGLTGAPVVLGASLEFYVDVTNALAGDTGIITGDSVAVTIGANAINFRDLGGIKTTIPSQLALAGKWAVQWVVVDATGGSENVQFTLMPDFGTANTQFLQTAMFQNLSVTGAKIDNATIDGSTKIIDDSITEAKLSPTVRAKLNAQGRTTTKVSIPSASVLTLNTVPIEAIPDPGAGYAIVIEKVIGYIAYVAPVYATNVNLQLFYETAGDAIVESSLLLVKTTTGYQELPFLYAIAAGSTQIVDNEAVVIRVEVGNPTAGSSDIVLYITWSVIEL